ncbi:hypothetical protein WN944_009382 [Citrus x changshan-huyou]|uniref:Uncharacterized protein n=1 Tax=Citrus x changshan-huyou TaxID=2935761 RepID=A0AAP0MPM9_9ROSI
MRHAYLSSPEKVMQYSRLFTSSNVLELSRSFRNWTKLALLSLSWLLVGNWASNLGGPQHYALPWLVARGWYDEEVFVKRIISTFRRLFVLTRSKLGLQLHLSLLFVETSIKVGQVYIIS